MRMGAAMMRLSNLYLTPARTGLIMLTVLLVGVIVVRVITVPGITVPGRSDIRTHTPNETSGRVTLDIGTADLRGSLP
jgi:hypothetical protein